MQSLSAMPYRESEIPERCAICFEAGRACKTCSATHCERHLMEGRCTACVSQLWQMERSKVGSITTAMTVLGVPAAVAGGIVLTFGGAAWWVGFAAMSAVLGGAIGLKKIVQPMIQRSLAGQALPPTSQRALPAPPFAPAQESMAQPTPRRRSRALVSKKKSPLRQSPLGHGMVFK